MKRRAYTLTETLLTILVMSLMMVMIGTLVRDYANTMTAQRAGDRVLAGEASLQQMRADVHQALNITSPDGPRLDCQLLEPNASRLPLPALTAGPWSPYSGFLTVSYKLQGDKLVRLATASSGTGSWVLLDDVKSFNCKRVGTGRVQLELTVPGVRQDQFLQAEAWWPRSHTTW